MDEEGPGARLVRCPRGRRRRRPAVPAGPSAPAPLTYTPLLSRGENLTSRSALAGERKQVTVLFADLKGSMELLADRDPEEARQLLDPVLEHMMAAVHRYEGTVNQVMGDGIMALFGAPVLPMRTMRCGPAMPPWPCRRPSRAMPRRCGAPRGCWYRSASGLNTGEVVVRAIGNDLHMDYSAVGQTTHLAAAWNNSPRRAVFC